MIRSVEIWKGSGRHFWASSFCNGPWMSRSGHRVLKLLWPSSAGRRVLKGRVLKVWTRWRLARWPGMDANQWRIIIFDRIESGSALMFGTSTQVKARKNTRIWYWNVGASSSITCLWKTNLTPTWNPRPMLQLESLGQRLGNSPLHHDHNSKMENIGNEKWK